MFGNIYDYNGDGRSDLAEIVAGMDAMGLLDDDLKNDYDDDYDDDEDDDW